VAVGQDGAKLSNPQPPTASAKASSTIRVRFSNGTEKVVRFFLNGGRGLETQLEAGKSSDFTMVVDAGIQPTVKIYQPSGKTREFTVADGGRYEFRVKDGEILNFFAAASGPARDQASELETEATRLWEEAQRLDKQGKTKEAVAAAEKLQPVVAQLLGADHQEVVFVLEWVAARYERLEDFTAAKSVRTIALQNKIKRLGQNHWQVLDARQAIARVDLLARLTGDQRRQLEAAGAKNDEALRLYGEGKYQDGLRAASEAAEVCKRLMGPAHPDYGAILINLALIYQSMGDYARAESLCRQASEVFKTTLGETHPAYAQSLNNLAELYRSMGDYAQAEPLYRQALEIRKKARGETHPDYATSLNNLAGLYQTMGDFARAESLFLQAKEIWQKSLGETHPDYGMSLNNLGLLYEAMGDYAKAEPLYRQALEICQKALGETHPNYGASLNNLAALYKSMGDYARAEPLYRQATQILQKALGDKHPSYATGLSNLAGTYFDMGDYARAEPLYVEASEAIKTALGESHPEYARSLNNLAGLYESVGDHAKAEPLYRQALEIRKKALGETHPDYATSLNNLAALYQVMGDYAKAEPLLRQALEIKKKALGETHPDYATSLNNLAALYHAIGDSARAESHYLQSAEVMKKALGETHPNYATSLNNLALMHRFMGNYAQAERCSRDSLSISRQNLELTALVQSERQQIAMLERVRHHLHFLIDLAAEAPAHGPAAYDEVLAWKGIVLGRQRAMRAAGRSSEVAPVLEELRDTATELATLSFGIPSRQQAQAWKRQIAQLSAKKEELEQKLAVASKAYRDALKPVTLADLRAALPKGAALVDFIQFQHTTRRSKEHGGGLTVEQRIGVFVVRSVGEVQFLDIGSATFIATAIDAWRAGQGYSAEAQKAAQTLREKIWLPIEVHLNGVTTVFICPDQDLGKLPFAALPGKTPGTYLLQECALVVVPAPQAVLWSKETRPAEDRLQSLLVVGGVDYDRKMKLDSAPLPKLAIQGLAPRVDRDAGSAFQPIPGTQEEMIAIGALFKASHGGVAAMMIGGEKASQQAVIQSARDHRYLHLATHGYFAAARFKSAMDRDINDVRSGQMAFVSQQSISGYNPGLLSGLALAGANEPTDEDDGIWTSSEVEALNLGNVELVVLSACETGLGKTAGGEGLLGLQRAFQVAGAGTVVASLWSVPDQATKALMVRFYENLWQKEMGKLEALREAQLWMLEHGAEQPEMRREIAARGLKEFAGDVEASGAKDKQLPPYYWAAWVLSGDWK
jgi:CHAT domain-containing protein/Tfp pilus assembly protein PilF